MAFLKNTTPASKGRQDIRPSQKPTIGTLKSQHIFCWCQMRSSMALSAQNPRKFRRQKKKQLECFCRWMKIMAAMKCFEVYLRFQMNQNPWLVLKAWRSKPVSWSTGTDCCAMWFLFVLNLKIVFSHLAESSRTFPWIKCESLEFTWILGCHHVTAFVHINDHWEGAPQLHCGGCPTATGHFRSESRCGWFAAAMSL